MGTVVSFDVPVAARHDGSLDAAVRWLHWVDRVFSPFRPDSDVSRLADGEVTVDGCAPGDGRGHRGVRVRPRAVRRLLHGVAVGPVRPVRLREGLGRRARRGHPVRRRVGQPPGQRRGRRAVRGRPPGRRRRRPGAPAPGRRPRRRGGWASPTRCDRGRLALVVEARDCGVATSGTAERGAHIVNPRAGRAAAGLASVTIVGPSLALADACATAAFAMGPDLARDWTRVPGTATRPTRSPRRARPGRPAASPPASPAD